VPLWAGRLVGCGLSQLPGDLPGDRFLDPRSSYYGEAGLTVKIASM
jgi:hypothetical protein